MPGTITFKPIEANLNQKSDIITNADPYCMFSVGDQKIKGQVCKSGGKHPVWEDTITVPAGNQPMCFVELKDKDVMKDDKLGSFEVDLREVETQGKLKKWYPIFLQNRPAGEILMEAVYSPDGMGQGVPVQQGMGMGMPVQQTMMTQQNMMPVQQTLMTQQPMMMPVQQHRVIEMQAAPNVVQETQVYTKETVISMPQQNLVQSQPMYGYDNYSEDSYPESLAEQYAREAMIRGIDPLGTHFHNYPQYNPALVGNSQIPQNNFGDPNIPASQL